MSWFSDWRIDVGIAVLFIAVQALTLHIFGQPTICTCGYVKVWEGVVLGSGNSQHLTDWYSFSHIIHGFVFYLLLWLLFPRMPILMRLAIATGMEVAWEITENTPTVINHYREQALAQGYVGDSVINSVSDTIAMIVGFLFASRAPVWATAATALGLELFVGYSIRDNLTLNVINLIHQFDFIKEWQSG
ncbi:MAG: DUF2585 domain-containing protein [Methylocella sp.]|nr:MAG: hypothetical protein DLM68_10790 [Hyphomicrobiales bacterium]